MRHHLGGDVRGAGEAVGDVLGGGKDALRLAEAQTVEPLHLAPKRARSGGDSENWPSSLRSSSYAWRNWWSSQTILFGWRTQ